MKKFISAAIAAALMVTVLATPALAHGHSSNGKETATNYSVCTIKSCTQTGLHSHSSKYYYAHSSGDGHDYHGYCSVKDCAVSGYHAHDGAYYFGHASGDGHEYHGYCNVKNCTKTGYHEHDGTYCFGHTSNDGHGYHNSRKGHH